MKRTISTFTLTSSLISGLILLSACQSEPADSPSNTTDMIKQTSQLQEKNNHSTEHKTANDSERLSNKVAGRWYSQAQVDAGKQLFAQTCAACHGTQAQGLTVDWKKPDDNGIYPPPPLNGSAHAWHHPYNALEFTILEGGAPVGGVMPPFKSVYDKEQIASLIASFQSYWSDEIYQTWNQRN